MAKTLTAKKRKKSVKKLLKEYVPYSNPDLKDSKLVSETLLDCIRTENLDSFRDVLASYILSTNKSEFAKKTGLGRRTLYAILDPEKKFDPDLSTVSAVIRVLAA